MFRDLGATLGRLDLALRGFFHSAADQDHPWSMEKCGRFTPLTKHLQSPDAQKIAATILSRFDTEVLPCLQKLRHQVIHQDAHAGNILVVPTDHTRIAGVIDFGDMLFGTLPAEIAVATDTGASHTDDLIDLMCETTIGFDSVYPLEEDEIDVLFDLILARNALTATIGSSQAALFPDEPAHVEIPENYVLVVDRLLSVGRTEVTRRLRAAIRFPAFCPTSTDEASSESEEDTFISSRHRLLGAKTKGPAEPLS